VAKVKDPTTGEERDETEDERKAREAAEQAGEAEDEEPTDPDARVAFWRKQSKGWERKAKADKDTINTLRTRLRDLEPAAARLKEIEDKNKSDGQKADEAKKAAEDRAATAERDLMRLRVAMRKGLTDAQAKRLVGATEAELETDADELLKSFVKSDEEEPEPGVTRRPRAALRPGSGNRTQEPEESVDSIVEKAYARRG